MKGVARKTILGMAIGVLLSGVMSSTPAIARTDAAPPESKVKHCVLTLGERPPGSPYNTIKSYECFTEDQELTRQAAGLAVFYTNVNFRGNVLEVEPGGNCDSDGYGIRQMPSGFDNSISSFHLNADCTKGRAFQSANYGGAAQGYGAHVLFVGSRLNDKITSFRFWKG